MSDDPTPDPHVVLDRRGRAAATGLRAAVADRPVPAFEPDLVRIAADAGPGATPPGRRPRALVAALAAAAAIVIVLAAVVATRGTGDPDSTPPVDRVGPEDLARYVLTDLPEGYALGGIFDAVDAPPTEDHTTPLVVYGPDASTPMLAVNVTRAGMEELGLESSEPIPAEEVGGRQAWWSEGGVHHRALLVEVDGTYVGVLGATADEEALHAAAAAVTVDGDRAEVPPSARPTGWSELGDAHLFDIVPGAVAAATTTAGPATWVAAYGGADGRMVYLSVAPGDELRASMPRLVADEPEVVDVRGHEAVLAPTAESGSVATVSLTWQERPGEVVQLVSIDPDVDGDALLGLARGIEPVDRGDVPGLRREALVTEAGAPGATAIGEGTFSDGTDWILIQRGAPGDGDLELLSTMAGGSSSGGSGAVAGDSVGGEPPALEALTQYTTGSAGAVEYAAGSIAGDSTVAVEVRPSGGGEPVAEAVVVEGGGVRAWVAELPTGAATGSDLEAVGRDAAGAETGSIPLGR